MENRWLTVKEIAEACRLSYEQMHEVLRENLDLKKLSARWVPRLLTIDQKRIRMDMSRECFSLFQNDPANRGHNDMLRTMALVRRKNSQPHRTFLPAICFIP